MLLQIQQVSTAPATEKVVGSVFDLIEWQYIYSIFYILFIISPYDSYFTSNFLILCYYFFLFFAENKKYVQHIAYPLLKHHHIFNRLELGELRSPLVLLTDKVILIRLLPENEDCFLLYILLNNNCQHLGE